MDPTLNDYTETLGEHGIVLPDDARLNDNGTLFDPGLAVALAQEALPLLTGDLVMKGPIGRGGMGEVLLASQTSLQRMVAVKRPIGSEPSARDEIVVEALVVGALEHPNIVPVHALGRDDDGQPLLVMKRIEGRTWAELLRAGRDLSRDVDILMQVCRALQLAHARGVIHRDVKPANVMVGTFGEVVLLDWGIAVGLDHAQVPALRAARTAKTICGTPQYMAPEMALPVAPADERTDVYLVGAVLHELLTGRPPHQGATIVETVHAASVSREPVFAREVPEDLAEICRRALEREPSARFSSVDELRQALAQSEGRRAAHRLIAEAEELLAQLRAFPLDADAGEVQRTFAACRFAWESALRIWADSARAGAGREQCLVVMAGREVGAGRLDSARLLLAELPTVPPELAEAVVALEEKRAREARSVVELEQLTHDRDEQLSSRPRALVALASLTMYLGFSVLLAVLEHKGIFRDTLAVFAGLGVLSTSTIAAGYLKSRRTRENEIGRSAFLAMIFSGVAFTACHTILWARGVDVSSGLIVAQLILALTLASSGAYHRGMMPSAVAATVGVVLLALAARFGTPIALLASGVVSFVPMVLLPAFLSVPARPSREDRGSGDHPG